MQQIEIWQPRWHDRVVLIAKHKVASRNVVVFTKTKALKGRYYVSGEDITACPLESNGKIECYAVPLDKLTLLD